MSKIKNKARKKHDHFWFTPHSVWQGNRKNEYMIARYCQCGEIQISVTRSWKKADKKTKVYPDVIDECKKLMKEI